MTIDERIEALAQSLELLSSMHQQTERAIEQTQTELRSLAESVKAYEKMIKAHDGRLAEHEKYLIQLMEGTARLLRVAESHDRRLSRLEGLPQDSRQRRESQ